MAITDLSTVDADGFYGQRGVNSYVDNEVEPSYRKTIYELNPNGAIQIIGLTSMFPTERETNATFNWWERRFAQRHDATTVYTTDGLGTQYAVGTSTSAQAVVYCKIPAALAAHIRERHQVKLSIKYNPAIEKVGEVMEVVVNGASSYLAVKLNAATVAPFLNSCNYISVVGNVNADGSFVPNGVSTQKVARSNHLQTFRNPIKMTRRAQAQKYRTMANAWAEENRTSLLYHNVDMELAALFGEMDDGTWQVDGEPQTTMEGIIPCLRRLNSTGIKDFYNSTDTAYAGKSWLQAGEEFVDNQMRDLFHYGPKERTCICGSGFLQGMNKLGKQMSQISISVGATSMGTKITQWITPHGVVYFKDHPLFTDDPTYAWAGLMIIPENIRMVALMDTTYRKLTDEDKKAKAGLDGYDGAVAEWMSDVSIRVNGIEAFQLWSGIGLDNVTYAAP